VVGWFFGKVMGGLQWVSAPLNMFWAAVGGALAYVSNAIRHTWQALAGLLEFVGGVFTGDWTRVWQGIGRIAFGFIDGIVQGVLTLVKSFLGILKVPLKLIGKGDIAEQWQQSIEGTKLGFESSIAGRLGLQGAALGVGQTGQRFSPGATYAAGTMGAGDVLSMWTPTAVGGDANAGPVVVGGGGGAQTANTDRLETALERFLSEQRATTETIVLQVDGESMARVVRGADRNEAISGFASSVPAEEGAF
jgi:hypothetical protein